jgi:hypothetical protein
MLEAEINELEAGLAALEAGQDASTSPMRLPSGWLLLGGGVVAVGAVVGRTTVESRKKKGRE